MGDLWKYVSQEALYQNLNIPDDWDSLESFVEWYIENKYPIIIPWDAMVRKTDDATTICIFRKNKFQVEIYLIYPNWVIKRHSHPGVEVITMVMGGGNRGMQLPLGCSNLAGNISNKLTEGKYHGGHSVGDHNGYVLFSFEKWSTDIPMTSAAVNWEGHTAGPLQDELIEKTFPGSVLNSGYADVRLSPKSKIDK